MGLGLAAHLVHVERFDLIDQLLQGMSGKSAGLLEHQDPVAKCHQGRNSGDSVLDRKIRQFVLDAEFLATASRFDLKRGFSNWAPGAMVKVS